MIPFAKQTENTSSTAFLAIPQTGKQQKSDVNFAELLGNLKSAKNINGLAEDVKPEIIASEAILNENIDQVGSQNNDQKQVDNEQLKLFTDEQVAGDSELCEVAAEVALQEVTVAENEKEISDEDKQLVEAQNFGSMFLGNIDFSDGKLVQTGEVATEKAGLNVSDLGIPNQSNGNLDQSGNVFERMPEIFDINKTDDSDAISQTILEELGFSKTSINENKQLRDLIISKIHQMEEMQTASKTDIQTAKEIISNFGESTSKLNFSNTNLQAMSNQFKPEVAEKISAEIEQVITTNNTEKSVTNAENTAFQNIDMKSNGFDVKINQSTNPEVTSKVIDTTIKQETVVQTENQKSDQFEFDADGQKFSELDKQASSENSLLDTTQKGGSKSNESELFTQNNVKEFVESKNSESQPITDKTFVNKETENPVQENSFTDRNVTLDQNSKLEQNSPDQKSVTEKTIVQEKSNINQNETLDVSNKSVENRDNFTLEPKTEVGKDYQQENIKVETLKQSEETPVELKPIETNKVEVAKEQFVSAEKNIPINDKEMSKTTENSMSENKVDQNASESSKIENPVKNETEPKEPKNNIENFSNNATKEKVEAQYNQPKNNTGDQHLENAKNNSEFKSSEANGKVGENSEIKVAETNEIKTLTVENKETQSTDKPNENVESKLAQSIEKNSNNISENQQNIKFQTPINEKNLNQKNDTKNVVEKVENDTAANQKTEIKFTEKNVNEDNPKSDITELKPVKNTSTKGISDNKPIELTTKEQTTQAKTTSTKESTSNLKTEKTVEVASEFSTKNTTVKTDPKDLKNLDQIEKIADTDKNQKSGDEKSSFSENSSSQQGEQKTIYNKYESEKTSTFDSTLEKKVVEHHSEKTNKINPLLDVETTKKVDVQPTNTKTVSATDLKEVIYKIERMISNAAINKINNPSFTIDAKEYGKMEIKVKQENKEEQGIILVESQAVKQQIQKHIPDIQENLQQKGVNISAINVEVNSRNDENAARNKFSSRQNSRKISGVSGSSQMTTKTQTIKTKSYGYNTMEILA